LKRRKVKYGNTNKTEDAHADKDEHADKHDEIRGLRSDVLRSKPIYVPKLQIHFATYLAYFDLQTIQI